MKILLTGAHLTPAIATIEELKKFAGVEIIYVGREKTLEGDNTISVESEELPKMGVRFISITAGRLQRSFTFYTIPSLLKIPIGFVKALYVILSEKPDVILSFGGYVALPVVIAGWLFSVPIIIHQQSLVAGLANRVSYYFADKIAVSFEENNLESEKLILTGNPIRHEILGVGAVLKRVSSRNKPRILITGGNQGSHVINLAVLGDLEKLKKIGNTIHVTGNNKYQDYQNLSKLQDDSYKVRKWIGKEWSQVLGSADLVVCRAGVNTLMELAYLKIPSLVVPIPYLTGDEQNQNARYFQKLGLVKILPQSQLSPEILLKNIKSMLNNLAKLKEKAKFAKEKLLTDGAKRLALETVLLVKK